MSTDALSLVGFINDAAIALNHLRISCVPTPATKSDAILLGEWIAAKNTLGPSFPSAGKPRRQPIAATEPHIQQLLASPWGDQIKQYLGLGADFQMVEIDPLLAYQITIDKERSQQHCNTLSRNPTYPELLNLCLPLTLPTDPKHVFRQGNISEQFQSLIIRSRSLNLGIWAQLIPAQQVDDSAGIIFRWRLPIVHVVEFNGNCYLHNGFHRVYGARLAGADYVPCLFRKAASAADAGIEGLPATFDLTLLESNDPPTVGHFTQGRALDVKLRASSRIIQISWAQHTIYEE